MTSSEASRPQDDGDKRSTTEWRTHDLNDSQRKVNLWSSHLVVLSSFFPAVAPPPCWTLRSKQALCHRFVINSELVKTDLLGLKSRKKHKRWKWPSGFVWWTLRDVLMDGEQDWEERCDGQKRSHVLNWAF